MKPGELVIAAVSHAVVHVSAGQCCSGTVGGVVVPGVRGTVVTCGTWWVPVVWVRVSSTVGNTRKTAVIPVKQQNSGKPRKTAEFRKTP